MRKTVAPKYKVDDTAECFNCSKKTLDDPAECFNCSKKTLAESKAVTMRKKAKKRNGAVM